MSRTWTVRLGSLHAEESKGTNGATRLVLLHGFTQTSRSWDTFVDAIGPGPDVCRIDAPGHGRSPIIDDDLATVAHRVVETGGDGVYVGYSMGARVMLHAAVDRSPLRGLVLIGGTPGIADDRERAERQRSDEAIAARIAESGVDEFLEWWLAQPLFAGLQIDPDDLARRRTNTIEGLMSSLRRHGVGEQTPLWDSLGAIDVPVLIIAGSLDAKFVDIGRRMHQAIGTNSTFVTIADCGHAAHLERPDEVARVVTDWIG